MNDDVEKKSFIKSLPFLLSLLAVSAFAGYGFNVRLWTVSFLVGLCVLSVRRKVSGPDVNLKKDILLFVLFYLLSTVLGDVVLFLSMLYIPFSEYPAHIHDFVLNITLIAILFHIKFTRYSGKSDETALKILWGISAVSFTFFLLAGFLQSPASALVSPMLFVLIALAFMRKSDISKTRITGICLCCFLYGEGLYLSFTHETVIKERSTEEHLPLIAAIRKGDKTAVAELAKTDANTIDEKGVVPLTAAVEKGDPEIVDILIKAGADVNYGLDDGWTAVRLAVINDRVEIVRMLTDAGAVLKPRSDESLWALALTGELKYRSDFRIFALLREKKAPFFVEGTTLSERLIFPFGLMRFK